MKSENVKEKRSTKEKEFLLLASNFTVRRVHCQYSSSQDNLKNYILVRKKSPNEKVNFASLGIFQNVKKAQAPSSNLFSNQIQQRPLQNSTSIPYSKLSNPSLDFPMIGDFICMDMRSSSKQETKIKLPNYKIDGGAGKGINKVQFGEQYKIKAANDDMELPSRNTNKLHLDDDPVTKENNTITKINDFNNNLDDFRLRSHINSTSNANFILPNKINIVKNEGKERVSSSNIIKDEKSKEINQAASENKPRELTQITKINLKLKEINSKLMKNENERYNLNIIKQEDKNINSKSTKLPNSIIMVKKEYMKSPKEINRKIIIIDSRKDNYGKLEQAMLRANKFVYNVVEKIEKNRIEKERMEKERLIIDLERKEREKLEREKVLLEREKYWLQKENERKDKEDLDKEKEDKDKDVNKENENKDNLDADQTPEVKIENRDVSPEKLRNSIMRGTKIVRNNSQNQGKLEKSISPMKVDVAFNKTKTNKILKDIIPKNKQLFV